MTSTSNFQVSWRLLSRPSVQDFATHQNPQSVVVLFELFLFSLMLLDISIDGRLVFYHLRRPKIAGGDPRVDLRRIVRLSMVTPVGDGLSPLQLRTLMVCLFMEIWLEVRSCRRARFATGDGTLRPVGVCSMGAGVGSGMEGRVDMYR